jgi:hypothetical protein
MGLDPQQPRLLSAASAGRARQEVGVFGEHDLHAKSMVLFGLGVKKYFKYTI